jgi:hypothetical protein
MFDQLGRGMGIGMQEYQVSDSMNYIQPQVRPLPQYQGQPEATPQPAQINSMPQPQYTDREVYDLNRQAALGYMDKWGRHVGQTRGSMQYNGSGNGGQHQHHDQAYYQNQNGHHYQSGMSASPGPRSGQGMGMGAGSWIGGVRETIDLTGGRGRLVDTCLYEIGVKVYE